jgi:hypothetical protein
MKKSTVNSVVFIAVILLSACGENSGPSSPVQPAAVNSSTASATFTLTQAAGTFTASPTITQTRTVSPTFTVSPTAGKTVVISFSVQRNTNADSTYYDACVMLNSTPVTSATVEVEDVEASVTRYLTYLSGCQYYRNAPYSEYAAGHTYNVKVSFGGDEYARSGVAAGDITIQPDGSQVSWAYDNNVNSSSLYVYDQDSNQVYASAPVSNPHNITYSYGPGSYSVAVYCQNDNGVFSGASGGWHNTSDMKQAVIFPVATWTRTTGPSPTITATHTVTTTPTETAATGASWELVTASAPFPERYQHESVVFNNKMWVIAGYSYPGTDVFFNDVWSSSDGVNWSAATRNAEFSQRQPESVVVFDEDGAGTEPLKMWVIGDISGANDVWSSPDGVVWTQRVASIVNDRLGAKAVSFNNKLWLTGGWDPATGVKNEVWNSADGVNWSPVAQVSPFTARWLHNFLVFKNEMYIIGGDTNSAAGYLKDVWKSSDGANWTQVTADIHADFSKRWLPACAVFNDGGGDKIYISAGQAISGSTYPQDVWSSADGATWSKVTDAAEFDGRHGHTMLNFNSKMWIISGTYNSIGLNDVWRSK